MVKKLSILFVLLSTPFFAQEKKWTIEECINYAQENNITIQGSSLDMEQTEINKKDAIGSFLPSLNMSASHSWNIGLNQNITTGLLENQTTQFSSAGFNVGVPIYRGLQLQNQLRKANLQLVSSQYQMDKMKEDISLNVANSFLQILFNKENVGNLERQITLSDAQLSRTQSMVDAGSLPKGDLLDIKATLAADKQRLIQAKNALFISKLALAQLLQLKDYKIFDVSDNSDISLLSSVLVETPESIVAKASESRIEVKIADANLAVAEKDVSIAKGALVPTISGFYGFSTRAAYTDRVVGVTPDADPNVLGYVEGTNQLVLQPSFSPVLGNPLPLFDQFSNNKGQNFGLQLSVPVFNGFSARNNVERAKIAQKRAELNKEQTVLELERNVYTAYTDAQTAKESYEAALESATARKESYEYAKARYEVGLMNVFDFNQAQNLLATADSEVIRTKYDFIFKTKIIELYFGIPLTEN
jgi:outer membrane protein